MRTYVLSYKGNEKMGERLKKQLKTAGFPNIEVIYAPDQAKLGTKPNEVVYKTFKENLLPKAEASKDDFLYFEDDADITSPYSKYKEQFDKGKLTRISYWKPQKHFVVGSTAVGFHKDIVPQLATEMRKKKNQHIDGFFTKFGNKLPEGQHYVVPKSETLGGTISHESYIMDGEFREGYRGGDQGGFKLKAPNKPYMEAGFVKKSEKYKPASAETIPKQAGQFRDYYDAPVLKKGFGIKRVTKAEGGSLPNPRKKKIKVKKTPTPKSVMPSPEEEDNR
mgnify:CR=1 FL=1